MIILLMALGLGVVFWLGPGSSFKTPALKKKILMADGSIPNSFFVYLALAKGYFQEEGLDLTLEPFPSGRDALDAMIQGKVHLATTAETPIMFAAMRGEAFYIIATLNDSEKSLAVFANRKRGIQNPADLEGRKIGVTRGTNSEFFLDSFLLFHHIPKDRVRVVDLRPDRIVEAFLRDEVDALSIWNPHTIRLQRELGNQGILWYSKEIYKVTWNLVAAKDWVNQDPDAVNRLFRALKRGESFYRSNPDSSRQITADYLKMDRVQLGEVWDSFFFKVKLEQSLLINLEDQARWAINNKLTGQARVPNFLNYFYSRGLKEVAPDSVTLIQ